ncbi:MAG: hypothetical protein OCD01_06285 [Fibrobacterales bacterium]
MNYTVHTLIGIFCIGTLFIACDKELSPLPVENNNSTTSENSSESEQSQPNGNSSIEEGVSSIISSSSSVSSPNYPSSSSKLTDQNSSSSMTSSDDESSSTNESSSEATPPSSSSSEKPEETKCTEYEEITCLQELRPYYDKNTVQTNYEDGEFYFFEVGFDTIKKYNCQICSDTITHSKVEIKFIEDCDLDNQWCIDTRSKTINKNLDEISTSMEVPEGFDPQFYLTFNYLSKVSKSDYSFEADLANITRGTRPFVQFYSITFTDETGGYIQRFSIEDEGIVDSHHYWKEKGSTCDIDECFN